MKIRLTYLLLALALSSCTVTELPDGTRIKQADRDVLRFAGDVVRAYSPKRIEPSK